MSKRPFELAGSAMTWKTVELVVVKTIFLARLAILARLLSPDDFGLMAIAVTAIGFLLNLTNFGMIPALIQGRDVSERSFNVAWTVQVVRALTVTLAVIASASLIASLFEEPRAADIIRILAFQPLLNGLASIKVARLNRNLHFRPLALMALVQAILNAVVSIATAPVYGVWALVFGTLVGSTVYLIASYIVAPHRPRILFDRTAAGSLMRFGQWIFASSLMAMAGSYVLKVAISRQLGTTELGLYYLAAQIAFLPAEIVSSVIGPVAFPLFAHLQTSVDKVLDAFRTVFTGTIALLYPACMLIIVLAPTLVQDVLGADWAGTVPIIRVLTVVTLVGLFGEVTGPMFRGIGQPSRVTSIEASQSVLLIIFVWIFAGRFGLVGAASAWLPAVLVSQVLSFFFMKRLARHPLAGLATPVFVVFLASVAGALAAVMVDRFAPGVSGLILGGIAGVLVTGAMLWLADRRYELGFVQNLTLLVPSIAGIPGFSHAK